jgi:chromosome segregation ATPase
MSKKPEKILSKKLKEINNKIKISFALIRKDVKEMEEQINLMRDYLKKKDKQISYARKEDNKLRNEFRRDVDDSKQNLTELKLALSKVRTIQEEVVLIKDLAKIEDRIKTSFKNEITRYKEVVKSLKEEVKESHKKISALEKGQIKEKKKGWFR